MGFASYRTSFTDRSMTRILQQQESCSIKRSRTQMRPCENAQRAFGSIVCSVAETFRMCNRLPGSYSLANGGVPNGSHIRRRSLPGLRIETWGTREAQSVMGIENL